MKRTLTAILFIVTSWMAQAQVATSNEVIISFFSEAPIEDIKSESRKGVSALDVTSRSIYFKVAIRSFEFEKSLMQEHFNENYLESDKYPYAEFNGNIKEPIDLSKDGTFQVTVQGDLNIHHVTRNYTVKGEIKVEEGKITVHAAFPVKVADHQIRIPRILIKNIAEVVEVTVLASYRLPSAPVQKSSINQKK
jgi:polyisoprenoid-binding protein YceI